MIFRPHPQAVTFLACPQKNSAFNVVHQLLGNLTFISLQYASSADAGGGGSPKKKKSKTDDAVDDTRRQFETILSPSSADKATEDSDDESSNGDKRVKPEDLHTNNPLDWIDGPFRHSDKVKDDVSDILAEGIKEADYGNQDLHSSGWLFLMSYDQIQNRANQNKLLSGIMPELMDLVTKDGFDVNRLSSDELSELDDASRRHFKYDYGEEDIPSNDSNDVKKEGSVYLKFILMSVGEWIGACKALLEGPKRSCTGNHRVFVTKLQSKLQYGVKNKWWGMNDTYSVPYIGESSAQSFAERMSNKYPTLFYAFERHHASNSYEFKVGSVWHCNSKQSKAMEAFVATILSLNSMQSRRVMTACDEDEDEDGEYVSCLCLTKDCSSFNQVICGDHILMWRNGGDGYKINEWLRKNSQRYRNTRVLECPQRDLGVIHFVFKNADEICHYINTTSREQSMSEDVRENREAPTEERTSRNDLTVEDVHRYWGWLVGNKMVREERGMFDPKLIHQRALGRIEKLFESLKEMYNDEKNHHDGYFSPPSNSNLSWRFAAIRRGTYDDAEYGLDTDFQRGFFLDKKDYEIKHLLFDEEYNEAREIKWDSVKFGHLGADYMNTLDNVNPDDAYFSQTSVESNA